MKTRRRATEPSGDFEKVLRNARMVEKELSYQFRTFQKYGNQLDEMMRIGRQHRQACEQLKRLEKDAPKILLEQGRVIDRQQAEKEIAEAFALIRNEVLALPVKCANQCVGKSSGEIMALLRSEIIECLRHLAGQGKPDDAGVDDVPEDQEEGQEEGMEAAQNEGDG